MTQLDELRARLEQAQANFGRRRTDLGTAIADGDQVRAATVRAEMATLECQMEELAAALPIVEARVQEAQRQEDAERRIAAVRLHNERRAAKLAAAAKVDRAMRALGRAWAEFEALPEVSNRASRNRPFATRAALSHWAPGLDATLELRRVPRPHWRPFAESETSATPKENNE